MDYKATAVQMNFLRLLTRKVFQNITYSCYTKEEKDCTIQLQGENEMELRSSEKTKPKFLRTDFKVQMNSSVLEYVVAIFTRLLLFFFQIWSIFP